MQLRSKDSYVWFLSLVVAYYSFSLYASGAQIIKSYTSAINILLAVGLVLIGSLNILLQKNRQLVQDIVFILFLVLIVIFFRKMVIFQIVSVVIAFLPVTANDTWLAYRNGIIISVILAFIFGLLGYSLYNTNTYDGVLTLGFVNENEIGYYLAFIAISLLFRFSDHSLQLNVNWWNGIFYVIVLLVNNRIFQDNTAVVLMIMFALFVLVKNKIKNWVLMIFILLAPFMTCFTYWISMNFYSSNWTGKFNDLVTMRPEIWNYFFTRYPISLFGGNQIIVSKFGYDYTPGQGSFDGSYAYMLYSLGILFTIFVVVGLSLAVYQLVRAKNYYVLVYLICLEFVGFSENIMYSYSLSFAIIFAFLAYRFTWFQKGIELVNETKSN
ncbi:hypothetical protein [Limosilactobacillus fermentum]|uniref:hypothetical protein n=1 Tax=Limosilactobacillus fermentum TaxID=1613 RepID=UPI0020B2C45E|nr:hypothetical protein [Limosilactobacillus fermentum]UTF47667.1 hypothetical protein NHN16_00495 [Limosilactobacillus fermentum]